MTDFVRLLEEAETANGATGPLTTAIVDGGLTLYDRLRSLWLIIMTVLAAQKTAQLQVCY